MRKIARLTGLVHRDGSGEELLDGISSQNVVCFIGLFSVELGKTLHTGRIGVTCGQLRHLEHQRMGGSL